ncbi:MAG: hypothetical protein HC814_04165 [Rhodobacteraceae bacterium]|nr:hypothetical protein [Paracoccaceae bacterium]
MCFDAPNCYRRVLMEIALDRQAALDAIMPDDDFGSTLQSAHSLGSLSGTSSIGGLIGTVTDEDFFTFTSGVTGTATFAANTTFALNCDWSLVGGGGTVDGNTLIEPRLGFNYSFDTELRTQLRGGVGLFQGSPPGVWLSNNFTNTGTLISVIQDTNGGNGVSGDPSFIPPEAAGTSPAQDVDSLDSDFDQPSVWKWNLAFERELPWMGLIAGAEFLVSETNKGVFTEHLNLGNPSGTLPDGRLSYWSNTNPADFTSTGFVGSRVSQRVNRNRAFNDVLLLRNTDAGHAENFTVSIEKPWENNWFAKLAYTYGEATDVSPGTSSRAISNWNSRLIYNPNDEVEGTSNYEIRDRWTGLLSKRWNFFDDAPTTVSFFYEGRSGRPFSYAFIGDANGDRINGNDLLYIPFDENDVLFSAASTQEQIDAFFEYIASNSELDGNRGEVAGRNADRAPWVHQVDMRLSQEIPLFADTRGELFLDILNVGNLLNEDWGHIDQAAFPYSVQVARFNGVDPDTGRYVYDVTNFRNGQPNLQREDAEGQSRWAMQVGFRFEF